MVDLLTNGIRSFDFDTGEKIKYFLMNKDEVVAKFSLQTGEFGGITEVEELRLPNWITNFSGFIEHRSAPRGRAHIQELLTRSGCTTTQGFLDYTHALSLTDTFWVKRADSTLEWKNVSLFRNPFNEVIAHTAFDGGMYGNNLSTPSPEYGTDGTFAKCWIRENDKIKMLKRGSSGARNAGLEPYSEYYASQVARAFECEHVEYSIRSYKGRICSACNCFTNEQYGFIPFSMASTLSTFNEISRFFIDSSVIRNFADMQVFDALIFNEDRHRGNFGFIFDTDTYEVVDFAPLFDHNISLLCYAEEEDFASNYVKGRFPRLGITFIENAQKFVKYGARRRLINMKGFKFDRDSKINLPDWRLDRLESLINEQIDLLLK